MKKVLLLSFLATGLLFSCSEEKKEEVKDDAAKVEAQNKEEDAASTKVMDEFTNEVKSIEGELGDLEAEISSLEEEFGSL